MGGLVTRLMVAMVLVFLGAACQQGEEDLIQGTWVKDDGTRIAFLDDNRVVHQPVLGRQAEGRYEWLGPSKIRLTKNHSRYGVAIERMTRTVLQVTADQLILQDEDGQVAAFQRR